MNLFFQYMKDQIWSIVFGALMAGALCLSAFQGFNLDQHALSDNLPGCLLIAALFMTALTVCGFDRRTIIGGVVGFPLLAAIFLLILNARNVHIVDELDSPTVGYIFPIVFFTVSVIVFLLSRSRIGSAVLFVLGSLMAGGLHYLEFDASPLWMGLFLAGCLGQFVLLEYRKNARASVQYAPAFGKTGALTAGTNAAAMLLAVLFFLLIIHPLHPGAKDLTLLTQHVGLENLYKMGIMDDYPVQDPDLQSDQIDDTEQEEFAEDPQSSMENDAGTQNAPEESENGSSSDASAAGSGQTQEATPISYEHTVHYFPLALLLLLFLLAASVLGKIGYRRHWLRRVSGMSGPEQIEQLYLSLLKKFGRVGLERLPSDSARVYVQKNEDRLVSFTGEGPDFHHLTDVFERVKYGQAEVSEQDCLDFQNFYNGFYKKCRETLGNLRYAKIFFFI